MLAWSVNSKGYFHGEERDASAVGPPAWVLDSAALENVKALAVGEIGCCVLNTDGSVHTFDNNGSLDDDSSNTLIAAFETLRIVDVFAGEGRMFAVDDDGRAYGWGDNRFGQLGGNDHSTIAVPECVQLPESKRVVQISCGIQHTLFLSHDGSVYAIGGNEFGQLGIGPFEAAFEPTEISSLRGLPIAQVVASGWQSFCVTVSGNVFCWGRNDYGQLGLGDRVNRMVPRPLCLLQRHAVKYVAGGDFHTAVLTKDGEVFTFGSSSKGQLGHDTISEYQEIPKMVSELMSSEVTQVACGKFHTIAYASNSDNVFAWGSNEQGQLGQDERLDGCPVPTIIIGPWRLCGSSRRTVRDIFAFGNQSLVMLNSKSGESSTDFREIMSHRRIWSIGPSLCSRVSKMENPGQVPTDIMQQLQCVMSSQSCLNASFLETDDHHNTNDRCHGLNMKNARLFFSKLMSCANKDDIRNIQSFLTSKMFPSLIANPLDIEALRVYILLPELGIFRDSLYHDTILFPFVEKLLQLGKSRLKILDCWYRSLKPDFFTTPIHICQECIVTTMKKNWLYLPPCSISTKTNLLLKFMHKMNVVNNSGETRIIDFREFYIPELNDPQFLECDYLRWVNGQFSFCQYPFVYDSEAKTILLQIYCIRQQTKTSHVYLRNLSTISGHAGLPQEYVTEIVVSREKLVDDGMNAIRNIQDFKLPLRVKFNGEEGLDWGGLRKEFFMLMIEDMLDPKYELFRTSEDSNLLWFNESLVEETGENKYYIFGTLCGLAAYNSTIIDINFPLALYKKLLGQEPNFSDLKEFEPEVASGMQNFVEGDGGTVKDMNLNFTFPRNGKELVKNGKSIPVTSRNRRQYVTYYVDYEFNRSIKSKFDSFKKGFLQVCDRKVMKLFKPEELREMVVGLQNYNWEELQKNTEYRKPFHRDHQVIIWFWDVFHSFTVSEKKSFLIFFSGSSKVPITGLKMLIQPKYNDEPNERDDDFLPVARTCFDILDLPLYTHKEALETKLKLAIRERGFHIV